MARGAPSGGAFVARGAPSGGGAFVAPGGASVGRSFAAQGATFQGRNFAAQGFPHVRRFHNRRAFAFGFGAPYYDYYATPYSYYSDDCYRLRLIRGVWRRVWVCGDYY